MMAEKMDTLWDLAQAESEKYPDRPPIVAAYVHHVLKDLQTEIPREIAEDHEVIAFVDRTSDEGRRIYRRSVTYLLMLAVHELYPQIEVGVEFSANGGLFCAPRNGGAFTQEMVQALETRMRTIAAESRPIQKRRIRREEAVQLFKQSRQVEKANLLLTLQQTDVSLYDCGTFYDYLYGPMLHSTQSLTLFALDFMPPGLLLRTPGAKDPYQVTPPVRQPKLRGVFLEAERWAGILHCRYIPDLNRYTRQGKVADIIHVSEALHEKRIAEIAAHIADQAHRIRLILIAGPSSSGKTSFAQRLRIQLRVNGLEPVSISLDDYFKNREDTPRTPEGAYDFESLQALDVDIFNANLLDLMAGKEVTLPRFNFVTGKREYYPEPISLLPKSPIIVEGIHGLNEALSQAVPRERKYKIYVSPLTVLNMDVHNRIPTTDARLLRRLTRDYRSRASSALKTLRQWQDVRRGEDRNIFPYQEEADVMFNSALIYELGVLKTYAEPLLAQVPPNEPEYAKAQELLDFCRLFEPIDGDFDIPNNSLLREFIGKSIFFR